MLVPRRLSRWSSTQLKSYLINKRAGVGHLDVHCLAVFCGGITLQVDRLASGLKPGHTITVMVMHYAFEIGDGLLPRSDVVGMCSESGIDHVDLPAEATNDLIPLERCVGSTRCKAGACW